MKKKTIFWIVGVCIVSILILVFIREKVAQPDAMDVFLKRVNSINYLSLETVDGQFAILSKDDINKFKRIILDKIKQGQFTQEGDYDNNLSTLLHTGSTTYKYYIGICLEEQIVYFHSGWFIPPVPMDKRGEEVQKSSIKRLYFKVGSEIDDIILQYIKSN